MSVWTWRKASWYPIVTATSVSSASLHSVPYSHSPPATARIRFSFTSYPSIAREAAASSWKTSSILSLTLEGDHDVRRKSSGISLMTAGRILIHISRMRVAIAQLSGPILTLPRKGSQTFTSKQEFRREDRMASASSSFPTDISPPTSLPAPM